MVTPEKLANNVVVAARKTSQKTGLMGRIFPVKRLSVVAKTPLIVALGVYLAGGNFRTSAAITVCTLSALLWCILYAVNETTDLVEEQGETLNRFVMPVLLLLTGLICMAGWTVSRGAGISFLLMAAGQIAYCMPPLRMKRLWWMAVLLSGGLNPVLRLTCGAVLGAHPISFWIYSVLVIIHVGGCIRVRGLLRMRDRQFGYKVIPEGFEPFGRFCSIAGLVGALVVALHHNMPMVFSIFICVSFVFTLYAWSGKETNVGRLRYGWVLFSMLTFTALILLWFRS